MEIKSGSTDERIINATFALLQKEGPEKTTTKKIAAEAGVNEITIFRKFETKNNLIEIVKAHYLQVLVDELDEIFDFNEDEEIDEFLKSKFYTILNLPETDFSIIKIAMEEVGDIPEKKRLISVITDTILNKLEEFFKLQIEKGNIKDVNPNVLAVICFSIIFQSVILWKIYNDDTDFDADQYGDDVLNILFNGIKAN